MDQKKRDAFKGLDHHAYLVIGGAELVPDILAVLETSCGIKHHGNPDVANLKLENMTIDEARQLRTEAEMRPVTDEGKKIFMVAVNSITVEAQNALLKLLEEPPEYAHFFLIVPSAYLLLATVRSRMLIIEADKRETRTNSTQDSSSSAVAAGFLAAAPAERLGIIKALLDDVAKERKSKQDAIIFLDSIQAAVYSSSGVKKGSAALQTIETARRYMNDRAPSLKMLLENVALNI